jgi:two-component system cell cycle sensor histidine kinase/response regulator CckA
MARGTILVVDDNLDICAFAKRLLESAGWTVVTAADGAEGLRFYEQHQSNIVLLLTDVVMPNIGGRELADRVLRMDSRLPVLFMSGDTWIAYRGLECIAKPFRSAELVASVSRVLRANARSETTASAA